MNRRIILAAAKKNSWKVCAIVAVIALIFMASRSSKKIPPIPPVPVVSERIVISDVPLYVETVGHCVASESVAVVPQVSGQIMAVHFEQGQTVKAGDPLYTIDPRTYVENLKKAEAQLIGYDAKARNDFTQFERSKVLVPQNYISQQQYETYESQVVQAAAILETAIAQLEQARIDLDRCRITSPIDGVTGAYLVDVGNVVAAMSVNKPLVTIENVDFLYVEFNVSENDFYDLQKYFAAGNGGLAVEVWPFANSETKGEARVEFIDNAINAKTGSLKLRAFMKNMDHKFWPGQSVRTRILLTILKDAVLVPAEAVKLGQQGRYVFVVKDDKSVEMRLVDIGQIHGDMLVIKSGVSAGEVVVKRGQLMLAPGMKVMELPDSRTGVFERSLEQNKKIAEKNPSAK
jgi:multidrug efflux system membrane fusion protein